MITMSKVEHPLVISQTALIRFTGHLSSIQPCDVWIHLICSFFPFLSFFFSLSCVFVPLFSLVLSLPPFGPPHISWVFASCTPPHPFHYCIYFLPFTFFPVPFLSFFHHSLLFSLPVSLPSSFTPSFSLSYCFFLLFLFPSQLCFALAAFFFPFFLPPLRPSI